MHDLDAGRRGPQPSAAGTEPELEPEHVVDVDVAAEVEGPVPAGRRGAAAEAGVALAALVLNVWSLDRNGYGNSYYAAAARSMTQGWKNFFYGALDPGGWITVDKPPAALWFQAAFAKVFGFSSWSLLLPSALAGAGAVWLLAVTVRRVWGRTAGLVAAAALALTPVAVAVSRSNNPDAVLVLAVVAAAWATERAVTTRRARWMVLAGAVCGFAFLTKLLAAGLVMPGLWLGYLLAARASWRRRLLHLLAATAAFAAVAGIWVGVVQLTPADSRPYIGGSTDGTALDLVLGYNGLGRITGAESAGGGGGLPGLPGGGRPTFAAGGAAGGGGVGRPGGSSGTAGFTVDEFGGTPGIGRLFNNGMGDQVMWLAPAAGAAVLAGAFAALRRRRLDARLGSLVLWTGWAGVTYVLFAFAKGVYHNYYVSLLAPAVAALVGIGVALALRAGRTGRVAVAAALAATAALQLVLLRRIEAYAWLRWLVPVGLGLVAAAWLVLALRRSAVGRRLTLGVLVAGAGVALLAPAVWSWNGTRVAQNGTFPDARPAVAGTSPSGLGAGGAGGAPGGGLGVAMTTWLRAQRTTETWIVAVGSSMQADAAIIEGDSVMAIGGFSGGDASMTPARLARLVAGGKLRFVMAGGGFGGFGGFGGPGGGGQAGGTGITTVVASVCTAVPASSWGGSGTSNLYDCAGKAPALAAATVGTSATPSTGQAPPAGQGAAGGRVPGGFEQLAACLQANGLTLPGPAAGGAPPNLDDPATAAAMQACAAYLPGA